MALKFSVQDIDGMMGMMGSDVTIDGSSLSGIYWREWVRTQDGSDYAHFLYIPEVSLSDLTDAVGLSVDIPSQSFEGHIINIESDTSGLALIRLGKTN